LLDCADRAVLTYSIDKSAYTGTVYDSYSPYKSGLVSWVVFAMVKQKQIYLKINKVSGGLFTFELATKSDALKNGATLKPEYIELDFTKFTEAKIICLLFELLAQVMIAMSKGVTASQGLLLQINALSEMIANSQNLEPLEKQIKNINEGLKQGKAAYIDAKSSASFLVYDPTMTEKAATYIFGLISTITGLPSSYLFGDVVSSIGGGDSGDGVRFDTALRGYFYNIWSGVCFNVYGENLEFKESPEDINQLISLFTFIETTSSLTEAGKLKFMVNNTAFDAEDFTYTNNTNKTPPTTTPPASTEATGGENAN
jgi:hypothetical protein